MIFGYKELMVIEIKKEYTKDIKMEIKKECT